MKLAMRLPEKSNEDADRDPREDATTEVIDFASRTSYPVVANRTGRSDALGTAAGIGFVALLGAAVFYGVNVGRVAEEEPVQAEAALAPAPEPAAAVPVPVEVPAPVAEPDPVLAEPLQDSTQLGINAYASPTLVFDAGILPSTAANIAAAEAGAGSTDGSVIPGSGSAGDFAARIGGVGGGPALAVQSFDPATTVTQGTMIPAVLETAINTDIPGYVRAVVSQDVRSADGSRILVPRSSRLVGQYQSGLQAGQKRAYVIWTTLIRPDGVSVQIASPATTFDGSTGLTGEVNTHFFQRFGSAMLLSVIGGLTAVASGGTSVILGGGQDAASTALQQNGDRPPTVTVRQGEPIRVFTSRHLDFSQAPQL
jgi:type IV secretion system protein VirB10